MGVGNEVDERVRRNEGAADWIGLDSMSWSHDYMVCAYVLMDGWMDGYPGVFSFFFFLALRTRCCGGALVFLTSFFPRKRSARVYIA